MLLNAEELLALANGDAEPDRLADLLDRLERCPASAEALQVLVTLKANRHEALAALREADDDDIVTAPMPHPAARRAASLPNWGGVLRLAATIAVVSMIGVWATSSLLGPWQQHDYPSLATQQFENRVAPPAPTAELTAGNVTEDALTRMEEGDYSGAKRLLEGLPNDAEGRIPLFLGMAEYFLGNYDAALAKFVEVRESPGAVRAERGIAHQAAWYEANSLLALDRPTQALIVLEDLTSSYRGFPFYTRAIELRKMLGMTPATSR